MTIQQVPFRDFVRGSIPADVLLLYDKKTKAQKGIFVKPEFADDVYTYLKKKKQEKAKKKERALLDFIGAFGNDKEFKDKSHKEIKALKYE